MGVVYHANYINWFEVGRTELLRQLGMNYRDAEERGLRLPVIDVAAKYIQPAKYDDMIDIYSRISSYSGVKLSFAYEIKCGERLLVTGHSSHCWTDSSFKPVPLKRIWLDLHQLIEKNISL